MAGPFLRWHLRRRVRRGKEDPDRLAERFGHASRPRPEGRLVWIHAASVGESLSALPLATALREEYGAAILMTTGTVTSAAMIAQRAPGVIHQYAPLDTPAGVARFLDHWRPDLALWIESEFWPTLVTDTGGRGIPLALVNGRISEKTARSWRKAAAVARDVVNAFDLRLVQTDAVRDRLAGVTGSFDGIVVTGDIKASRPAEAPHPDTLASLRATVGTRPLWLAASTHPGEEEAVADAHCALSQRNPDVLTILAPRHPERGAGIAGMIAERGIPVSRRSAGDVPRGIYVADTLGEMPLWFALAPIACIGAGWGDLGGHNPLEAAQAGTAILSGPKVANFAETYASLDRAGAVRFVEDAAALAGAVLDLTDGQGHPNAKARAMAEAAKLAGAPDSGPLDRTMAALAPLAGKALR